MIEQGAPLGSRVSAVLDTNSVLDMLLFDDPAAWPLREALAAGTLRWIATERMRAELQGVLLRPQMGRWQPPTRAAQVLDQAAQWMRICPPAATGGAPRCRDPADQPFIDLAWSAGARWLITRDKALLKLARPARLRGVTVCTPGAWTGLAAELD
jgi:predicted nucleic acid-binding protein